MLNILYSHISLSCSFSKMAKYSGKKCRLLSMMWLTAFFFFVEIIVGYVTNSMALVADSFHMLGDIAALVISFLSVKVSPCRLPRNITYITHVTSYLDRCHRKSGRRTLSAGPGLRFWVLWSTLFSWWPCASASPLRPARGECPILSHKTQRNL